MIFFHDEGLLLSKDSYLLIGVLQNLVWSHAVAAGNQSSGGDHCPD
jgi:hypothetical protein